MFPRLQHPTTSRAPRALPLIGAIVSVACLFATSAEAQMQYFGDWVAPLAEELYVSSAIGMPGPGSLLLPLPTVSSALALAATNGFLGNVPVTINVLDGPQYNMAQGETFPIRIPAHGVTIEAYYLTGGTLPSFSAMGSGALDTFLIDSVGNPALPDSVLRGLEMSNIAAAGGVSNVLRIETPNPTPAIAQRVAPEVRDCRIISQGANYGIQIVGRDGINLEPVIERNWIDLAQSKFSAPIAGVRVAGGISPTSPLIRSNEIQHFPTNVLLEGGDLTNQPRVHGNFIQVGATNVRVDSCAPFLIGNTIAFAYRTDSTTPIGVQWTNVLEMDLVNNLIWNPEQPNAPSVNPIDVMGSPLAFAAPNRQAWFNYDHDDGLFAMGLQVNFGPVLIGLNPDMVGNDSGKGSQLTDMHLNTTSVLWGFGDREQYLPVTSSSIGASVLVPGFPAPIVVRRDEAYDIDFDARVSGFNCEIGADEISDLNGLEANSPTRGASLVPTVGSPSGSDLDAVGNLLPSPLGEWRTSVDVLGTPDDIVVLLSGVGFFDFVTDPAFPGVMIENTAVYQNFLLDGSTLGGMTTLSSVGVDLAAGSVNVAFMVVPLSGVATFEVNFGALNPAFLEAEAHLQAFAFDDVNLGLLQTTNRLSLDLNE